jgi:hypothetical protein
MEKFEFSYGEEISRKQHLKLDLLKLGFKEIFEVGIMPQAKSRTSKSNFKLACPQDFSDLEQFYKCGCGWEGKKGETQRLYKENKHETVEITTDEIEAFRQDKGFTVNGKYNYADVPIDFVYKTYWLMKEEKDVNYTVLYDLLARNETTLIGKVVISSRTGTLGKEYLAGIVADKQNEVLKLRLLYAREQMINNLVAKKQLQQVPQPIKEYVQKNLDNLKTIGYTEYEPTAEKQFYAEIVAKKKAGIEVKVPTTTKREVQSFDNWVTQIDQEKEAKTVKDELPQKT